MPQFRLKQKIEAVQWTGKGSYDAMAKLFAGTDAMFCIPITDKDNVKLIWTDPSSNRKVTVNIGDWVIKESSVSFCPISAEIFERKYEAVE
jgi:hypothetical protein